MNDVLPDNAGYVAAAYLTFVLLLLVYLAITAYRLRNLERELSELVALADRDATVAAPDAPAAVEEPAAP